MQSRLDRKLQKDILELLAANYPRKVTVIKESTDERHRQNMAANLSYLEEHGLIEAGLVYFPDGTRCSTGCRITAHGLDFMLQDGGLAAILGTTTRPLSSRRIATSAPQNMIVLPRFALPPRSARLRAALRCWPR